jgi:aryl-alcohol dehydrogenase-like predicted oxidoreductase
LEPFVEGLPHRPLPGCGGKAAGEGRRTTFTFPPVDPDLGERALVALAAVADGRGMSMAQVALAWVLAQPGITSAIVGASSLEQLDDNLAAAQLSLTTDELAALDAATAVAPIYPAWWDPAMGIPGPTDLLPTDILEDST